MDDVELRMRCIEAAVRVTKNVVMSPLAIVTEADRFYEFVKLGQAQAPKKKQPRRASK